MARIYVASSWRNDFQPMVVAQLERDGHQVYDFKNPPNKSGFGWEQVAMPPKPTVEEYLKGLSHPIAAQGFLADFRAMKWADVGVLVLPCGRSAHLELGWMAGAGKRTIILTKDHEEPELMALLADHIVGSLDDVRAILQGA